MTSGEIPVYGKVPPTTFIDTSGEEFSTTDLEGKVWALSLIFTHCAASCPRMTSQFARFQEMVTDPNIHLVSISVDPARDTPERMKEYADLAGADLSRWHFLTGDLNTVVDLAENHLKIGSGQANEDLSSHPSDASPEAQLEETMDEFMADEWEAIDTPPKMGGDVQTGDYQILHSDRFVLIDQQGRIRGYYAGLEDEGLENLKRDALRLASE
ncbi:MAG: SCO family protein [Candidatus Omnitrophica bacterium]|nr:SCO family protein [Candidatus Omnitrophota bacterium]